MIQESDEIEIRKYLLGQLADEVQAQVEERLMAEDDYFNLLEVAEDELIDDRLAGELTRAEQEQFDAHFLSTPERCQKFKFAETLRDYVSTETRKKNEKAKAHPSAWWNPSFSNPYLRGAAAAIIIIGLGVLIIPRIHRPSEAGKGIAALKEAYRNQRPVEARITDFEYAPLPPVTRGGKQEKFDYAALDRANLFIQNAVADNPDADSYHALGLLYLANHEPDKAIEQFEKALKLDEKKAKIENDLAAAYLERAFVDGRKPGTDDMDKCLAHLKQAIELDNSLLAAYFNRALCLQKMNALLLAKEAWEDYLKRDNNSEWSKEAERNLQRLQNQGANKTPDEVLSDFLAAYQQKDEAQAWRIQSQTKEMITGTMIPFHLARRFLDDDSSDQPEPGKEILGALRFSGELEKKRTGDLFFGELAEFYSIAGRNNAVTLKQAHQLLQQGYQLCLRSHYSEAKPLFENAHKLFLTAGNIWESRVVDYWQAYCLSYAGELKKSSSLLDTLAKDSQRKHYYWLQSQSYNWLAFNSAQLGDYSLGVEQDQKALHIATAADDLYLQQKISSQIANEYIFFGRFAEALEFNNQSLPLENDYFVSIRQFWRSLGAITDTLLALRLCSAAEAYEREALQLALNHCDDPALTNNTYRRLGQVYVGQQDYPAAAQAFQLSLNALRPIEDDRICKKLSALSILQIANMKRLLGDYPAALQYYNQAAQDFDSFNTSEFGLNNYTTHKGLLLCHLLNKDEQAIEKELPIVLSLFEQNREKIKEEQNRNPFFDAEQSIYDLAIDYEYQHNNKERSFHYIELSRARSLQDALRDAGNASKETIISDNIVSSDSQLLISVQLQKRLPPKLQLIEYAVLQDRLLIWIITKTQFVAIQQPVSRESLESVTDKYLQALTRDDADSIEMEKQLATQLHDWLFAPVEDYLNETGQIALALDKFLFKVPFVALLSRQSGQRVINKYTLFYAPSATTLIRCCDMARMKGGDKTAEHLLSVGDPVFDQQQYRNQPDLPSAATEARKIALFYLTKSVLIKERALKQQVVSEMVKADVIQFAAHYLADGLSPAKSKLLLTASNPAKANEASDDLSLQDIQNMRLPKSRVAILSACQSGIERYYAGEGLMGLSRAFLIAGVPLVIATQWRVESEATADLMIEFHRWRKTKNLPTVEALRKAQLVILNQKDERYRRPYYWAAFFPIGGYASY